MGSKTYDYLTDSFLFDQYLIDEQFRSVPEAEILKELQSYRQFCLSVTSELEQEVLSNTSNLKIFSGIKQVDINLLKQSPGILSLEGSLRSRRSVADRKEPSLVHASYLARAGTEGC